MWGNVVMKHYDKFSVIFLITVNYGLWHLRFSTGMVAMYPVQPKKQAIIFLEVNEQLLLVMVYFGNIQAVNCCFVSVSYKYI